MRRAQPVTSQEVARQAGVSRATVSYVLNGVDHQRISAATRTRVMAVAQRLGYSPNAAALALRDGRTNMVILSLPAWPHGPVIIEAIDTAVAELRDLGYTPLVHFEQPNGSSALTQACQRLQPVGLIAPGERISRKFVQQLHANWTKGVVAIDLHPLGYVPTIVVVQAEIGRTAIHYLASKGHRRVLALMPADPNLKPLSDGRIEGAKEAADEAGIRLRVVESGLEVPAVGHSLLAAMTTRWPPTAIYTFNDDYAFVALRALLDQGLQVPGDVSLLGCDDVMTARLIRPELTTVKIDGRAFGSILARTLHGAISDTPLDEGSLDFLHPEVIQRESA